MHVELIFHGTQNLRGFATYLGAKANFSDTFGNQREFYLGERAGRPFFTKTYISDFFTDRVFMFSLTKLFYRPVSRPPTPRRSSALPSAINTFTKIVTPKNSFELRLRMQ